MSSAIPINNTVNDSSVPLQISRESLAHSQGLGGISWGGASVGSWIREEVLMATKDYSLPNNSNENQHLPSALEDSEIHDSFTAISPGLDDGPTATSSSAPHSTYFPEIEAEFCKDYSCCGNLLPTLHDLLRHYEEEHISPSPPDDPPVIRRMQNIGTVSTIDVFLPFEHQNKSYHSNDNSFGNEQYNLSSNAPGELDAQRLGLGNFCPQRVSQPQPFAPPLIPIRYTPY